MRTKCPDCKNELNKVRRLHEGENIEGREDYISTSMECTCGYKYVVDEVWENDKADFCWALLYIILPIVIVLGGLWACFPQPSQATGELVHRIKNPVQTQSLEVVTKPAEVYLECQSTK
jgi:hypothetical protein